MKETLSILAGLLVIAAFVPYIRAILRKETIPMKASWLIWALSLLPECSSRIRSMVKSLVLFSVYGWSLYSLWSMELRAGQSSISSASAALFSASCSGKFSAIRFSVSWRAWACYSLAPFQHSCRRGMIRAAKTSWRGRSSGFRACARLLQSRIGLWRMLPNRSHFSRSKPSWCTFCSFALARWPTAKRQRKRATSLFEIAKLAQLSTQGPSWWQYHHAGLFYLFWGV